jgi:hypothetical protein
MIISAFGTPGALMIIFQSTGRTVPGTLKKMDPVPT